MKKPFDLDDKFQEYFNEMESFGLNSEQFHAEELTHDKVKQWLRAAFVQGAKVMGDHSVEILYDYGTACAGLDDEHYNDTQAFDMSAKNLEPYIEDLFREQQ